MFHIIILTTQFSQTPSTNAATAMENVLNFGSWAVLESCLKSVNKCLLILGQAFTSDLHSHFGTSPREGEGKRKRKRIVVCHCWWYPLPLSLWFHLCQPHPYLLPHSSLSYSCSSHHALTPQTSLPVLPPVAPPTASIQKHFGGGGSRMFYCQKDTCSGILISGSENALEYDGVSLLLPLLLRWTIIYRTQATKYYIRKIQNYYSTIIYSSESVCEEFWSSNTFLTIVWGSKTEPSMPV